MTQGELADRLRLTYQQIQKYETGISTVSASRLFQLAQAVGVAVEYFFEDAPLADRAPSAAREATVELDGQTLLEFVRSPYGVELNSAFARITEPEMRRAIVELVRAVTVRSVRGG